MRCGTREPPQPGMVDAECPSGVATRAARTSGSGGGLPGRSGSGSDGARESPRVLSGVVVRRGETREGRAAHRSEPDERTEQRSRLGRNVEALDKEQSLSVWVVAVAVVEGRSASAEWYRYGARWVHLRCGVKPIAFWRGVVSRRRVLTEDTPANWSPDQRIENM